MEKRTIVAIIGFFIVSVGAFLVSYSPNHGDKVEVKPRPLPPIQSSTIAYLDISQAGGKDRVILSKKGETWRMTSPSDAAADEGIVKAAVDSLGKLEFIQVTSEKKEQFSDLDVSDDKAIHVIAKDHASNLILDVYIGKDVGSNTMVRIQGKEEVWKAEGLSTHPFSYDAKRWREHALFKAKADDIEKIVIEGKGQSATLERLPLEKAANGKENKSIYDAKWKLVTAAQTSGVQAIKGEVLDEDLINRLASGMISLKADDFDDQISLEHIKEVGLDVPNYQVHLFLKDGLKAEMFVGIMKDGNYFVKTSDSSQIFLLQKAHFENLFHLPKDILDKTLVLMKADQIQKISVEQGKELFAIQSTEKGFVSEQVPELDERKIKSLVASLERITGNRFVETDDVLLASLREPKATITIESKTGAPLVLKVGDRRENEVIVQKVGQADAVWVRSSVIDAFLKKPEEWKKSPILGAPPGTMIPGR